MQYPKPVKVWPSYDSQDHREQSTPTVTTSKVRRVPSEKQENSVTWSETNPRYNSRLTNSTEDFTFEAGNAFETFRYRNNWMGQFDPTLQKEFELFCKRQRSLPFIMLISGVITLWFALETVASLLLNFHQPVALFLDLLSLVVSALFWITCFACFFCLDNKNDKNSNHSQLLHHLQTVLLPLFFAVPVLKAIEEIAVGTYVCSNSHSPNPFNLPLCPPSTSFYSLVCYDKILILSLSAMLVTPIFHESRLMVSIGCQIIVALLVLVASFSSVSALIPVLICVVVILAITLYAHYHQMKAFRLYSKMQQLVEQRNEDKLSHLEIRSVIGNVAHDLKTPLASFATGTEIIQSIISATQEKIVQSHHLSPEILSDAITSMQTCLQNIRNTNAFMLMTINRCIDYTKATKGLKLVPKYETIDLKEVLEFPIACMRNIQERIGITLQPLPSEICSHVITDKQWLQENLLCLLSNAVKYSTAGVVTINSLLVEGSYFEDTKVLIDHEQPKRGIEREISSPYLLFEIEDTGIGVPEEAMNALFSPFKQAQRLAGGTGLGLYSLAKRIDALKGYYGVKRRRDGQQGSLFWFAIPYRPDKVASNVLRTTVEEKSEKKDCFQLHENLEILIVDDSPSIVKITTMMLKRYGHQIDSAANGEIGLQKIETKWKETGRGYDLVLMDLEMPIMDGLEATKRLRKIEKEGREWLKGPLMSSVLSTMTEESNHVVDFHHQVVFGVSANVDEETTQVALSVGMDTLLEKPLSIDALNRSLAEFCS